MTFPNSKLGLRGCCQECGDRPSPELIQRAVGHVVKHLAQELRIKYNVNYRDLPFDLQYELYLRKLGIPAEEIEVLVHKSAARQGEVKANSTPDNGSNSEPL